MLRMIKADLYRIVRGKALYITTFIAILLLALMGSGNQGSFGVQTEEWQTALEGITNSGKNAPLIAANMEDNLIYFILVILIIVVQIDFSEKSAKNILSGGVDRGKYYWSKWIVIVLSILYFMVLNIIVPFIAGSIRYGFEGGIDADYVKHIVSTFGLQFLLLSIIVSFGFFLSFTVKKTGAVIGGIIGISSVPMIVILLIGEISPKINMAEMLKYEIVSNIRWAADPFSLAGGDIVRMILMGALGTLFFLFTGFRIFKKCEIK